jgi:hypothetical protein
MLLNLQDKIASLLAFDQQRVVNGGKVARFKFDINHNAN